MVIRIIWAGLLSVCLMMGQRDFLSADEIDQVRLAQEPNERITLYLSFARLRAQQIEQSVSKNKPGHSVFIHDLLEDYTKLIEAIDTVSDDALKRKLEISESTKAIVETNRGLLAQLEKIRDAKPKDLARYQFALDQAIDTTRDSAELAAEDLAKRSTAVAARTQKEQKDREENMRPEDVKVKQETVAKEVESKRKAPTLRRKGEIVKQP